MATAKTAEAIRKHCLSKTFLLPGESATPAPTSDLVGLLETERRKSRAKDKKIEFLTKANKQCQDDLGKTKYHNKKLKATNNTLEARLAKVTKDLEDTKDKLYEIEVETGRRPPKIPRKRAIMYWDDSDNEDNNNSSKKENMVLNSGDVAKPKPNLSAPSTATSEAVGE